MFRARSGLLVALVVAVLVAAVLSCKPETPVNNTSATTASGTTTVSPATKASDPKLVESSPLVDLFPGMDGPNLQFTQADLQGRNVWNLWCGDNGGLWNYLSQNGFGTTDLLKTIDSRARSTRFRKIGIINQPGFRTAAAPDALGLFLDEPRPGDPDGTIDQKLDGYTYGRSSGVVGLRLFPNPDFTDAKKAEWMTHVGTDGINHDYYEKPTYYNDKNLVRPYVVGMACAFCHVGPDPVRPPPDPEEPKWENLNDYIGAQYFRVSEVFGNGMGKDSFVWQLLNTNQPGTLDTSFIATDYLNNPGSMNAVFNFPQRLARAQDEEVKGGSLALLDITNPVKTPRVLKEGADSLGFRVALSRVYVNIGEDWRQWTKQFNPIIGGIPQKPIEVAVMQRDSPHWNWSESRAPLLAGYLIKVSQPLLLKDTKEATTYLTAKPEELERGKRVFAENCAGCHSSKQPPDTTTDPAARRQWFVDQAMGGDPAFFTDNFFGDERRHPVSIIGTNATRSSATNALRGHIWDNFSSETYKTLPAVSPITVEDPFDTTKSSSFQIAGGGPGYYRPPSLISLWATAPYLHNNMVGTFNGDPSVKGRMAAFEDGIHKMLWPKDKLRDRLIWKTNAPSYITVPVSYIPPLLRDLNKDPILHDIIQGQNLLDDKGNLQIGPIPQGTPINLLANTNLDGANPEDLLKLVRGLIRAGIDIKVRHLTGDKAAARWKEVVPLFMKVNKCPDFIEDKGHMFGTSLPEDQKQALVALLKTF
jgi:hypothetical protein